MYSAVDVAKYIIWYCKRQGYSISNLKLQKILYFVQADFLVTTGTPCFEGILINEMVDECADYSASALVEITHNQSPWCNAYEKRVSQDMNRQLISLVSIFTALSFLIFGGISSLDNIFIGAKDIPVTKLVFQPKSLCLFQSAFYIVSSLRNRNDHRNYHEMCSNDLSTV